MALSRSVAAVWLALEPVRRSAVNRLIRTGNAEYDLVLLLEHHEVD